MRLKTSLFAAGIAAFALFGAAPAFAAEEPSVPPSQGDCPAAPAPAAPAEGVVAPEEGGAGLPEECAEPAPGVEAPSEEPSPSEGASVAPDPVAPEAAPAPPVERDPNYTG
ncbi:hypothetical protein [Nocardiopsis tropica]|uniref:Uncharacterized protein n=1 Tax=Nocardiopsis tropica TaxID=109330 RepID=A0ABU7KK96_9ACTN|nr:hypothetical protein [Nocardiopsis umidischolae]MEE2049718.1 hypothetical protein [Nocardiopsis umidischolae]